jgi:hypothetical protein
MKKPKFTQGHFSFELRLAETGTTAEDICRTFTAIPGNLLELWCRGQDHYPA